MEQEKENKQDNVGNVKEASDKDVSSGNYKRDGKSGDRPQRKFNKSSRRDARAKPEFDQKIISIRRVARVMSGGRRFSFSVSLVAGNRKGSVGVGVGKATDTPLAIEKAFRDAKKNMVVIKLNKHSSIPHEVWGKVCSSRVFLKPTSQKSILAGGSVRDVVELAGIKNISSKIISRSKNRLNNAKAAVDALGKFNKGYIHEIKTKAD